MQSIWSGSQRGTAKEQNAGQWNRGMVNCGSVAEMIETDGVGHIGPYRLWHSVQILIRIQGDTMGQQTIASVK